MTDKLTQDEITKRMGKTNADGSKVFPALNIEGSAYDRPGSTLALDVGHFIVLPPVAVVPDAAQIEAWKAMLGLTRSSTSSRSATSADAE